MTSPAEGGTERQVVRALGSIGAATLASRILGFVRDAVVALAFGAGPVTDAFFVAFRIPNILRRLLAEGALSTAMVPVFSDYAATRPRDEFVRMLRAVSGVSLAVLVVTVVLGVILSPWLLRAIAPGFSSDPAQASLAVLLTRVMFPYVLLVGLSALVMGALNAHGRFFAAALGPAVLNLGMIAGVLVLAARVDPAILALAIGVLVGGVGQLAVQLPSLRACGLLAPPVWQPGHPAVRRVARLLLPAVFGLAAVQVMVFVNTLLASLLPSGSISYLYYADRVMEFPLGIFGIALASASLPAMSRQAAAGDTAGVAATLGFALRLSVFVSLPATVGLVILSEPIIRVLFERGLFTAADTAATAHALVWYSVGLTGFAGSRIVAQAFYAVGQPGTAVRLGIMAIAVNAVSALVLMTPMAHAGLALASSIGTFANLAGLVWVARRRFGPIGGRTLAVSTARVLVACLPLAAWCLLARWLIPAGGGPAVTAGWVAAAVTGGTVLYIAVSGAVGSPEHAVLSRALPWRRSR
ncbi:MAG: murein biosynthesis integral membrane protein MurJ [Candidatus Rokuibacteriota bacterium]